MESSQKRQRSARPRRVQFEELRARIESWRKHNESAGRRGPQMPEDLWQAVLALARAESPAKVIEELGVKPSTLYLRMRKQKFAPTPKRKRRRARRRHGSTCKRSNTVKFVQIGVPEGAAAESRIELVIERAHGGKLKLLYPESHAGPLSRAIDQLLKAA